MRQNTNSCLLQIAPAETPDSKMRMVIVTGPPEAQFKVSPTPHKCSSDTFTGVFAPIAVN